METLQEKKERVYLQALQIKETAHNLHLLNKRLKDNQEEKTKIENQIKEMKKRLDNLFSKSNGKTKKENE